MTPASISPVMLTASLVLAGCVVYLVSELVSSSAGDATGRQTPVATQPASEQSARQSGEGAAAWQTTTARPAVTGAVSNGVTPEALPPQVTGAMPQRASAITAPSASQPAPSTRPMAVKAESATSTGYSGQAFLPGIAASVETAAPVVVDNTGSAAVTAASQEADTASVADTAVDNTAASESVQPPASDEGNGYAEVTAEVQIDLDEKQSIRCYPVSNQSNLPCMCEFTLVKEGRVQTELVDNCNL